MSRVAASLAMVVAGFAAFALAPARADSGPVIVIPSRPGIPIIINGLDASYAVVEGDWGLSRPGAGAGMVTVYGGSPVLPNPVYSQRHSYHPRYGRAPERGRNEAEPAADRLLPEPAESFSRSWSTSSDVTPASDTARPWSNRVPPVGYGDDAEAPATITDPQTFNQDVMPSASNEERRRRHPQHRHRHQHQHQYQHHQQHHHPNHH
jgi:hypothetical protein